MDQRRELGDIAKPASEYRERHAVEQIARTQRQISIADHVLRGLVWGHRSDEALAITTAQPAFVQRITRHLAERAGLSGRIGIRSERGEGTISD